MLFSSISFAYYFLPLVFAVYFAMPRKFRNLVLLVFSLFFYFYGEPKYVFLLLLSSAIDFTVSLVINKHRGTKAAKRALLCSVLMNLSILIFFKYSDFFIANINALFGVNIPLLHIPLPLGVSFYTFQTMSYAIDVYRNDAQVQKNPLDFATYVSLFPQLVAGPIVRYQTVADQMTERKHSLEGFAEGAARFVMGLGKKVLIANALGELNKTALTTGNQSVLMYWLAITAFMLQIYFDFSGYSDMALGLGKIFGFTFLENFNYPFIARSITDFWRRWHISMGTWFREYIYIPLGGNRVPRWKWIRNIAVVWFCTGFWHGAAWNFIVWGLYFGVLLTLEKLFILQWLEKIPRICRHIYCLLVVTVSFVIFHLETLPGIWGFLKGMFGFGGVPLVNAESAYYLNSYKIILLAAVIGATPLLKRLVMAARANVRLERVIHVLNPVYTGGLLLVVSAYLVDSSFNPFLYFRF
ncbi:MAG: MBOAT family protein [Oscillospiraceae bacterium]|jgi:alginate O-acetyltransferase complex protein AlgI|nr:MBOAT family protein [Oscillospiraceae bacterium]